MISAGLLLALLRRLVPEATAFGAIALAGVWLVHPVHADSALLASGRTALLSNLFVFAALLACYRSRWLMALLFGLACFSRETAIAALLPLMVLTAARHQGAIRPTVRWLAPTFVVASAVLLWLLTTPRYLALAEYSMLGRPFWESFIAQVGAVPAGFSLLVNPTALSIDYGIALPTSILDLRFLLGALLYGAAGVGIVMFIRRSPAAAVGLALWLAALLPTQSVVPKLDALTNRPLSLGLAGLILALTPLLAIGIRWAGSFVTSARRTRVERAVPLAVFALVAMLTFSTATRANLFRSELQLWQDAAAKSVVNERPHLQYAVLLRLEGRVREAREALKTAARINPFNGDVTTLARIVRTEEDGR